MNANNFENLIPPLLYEDKDLLVINKTPGLLSVPDGYHPTLPHLRSVLAPIYGELWIVHRLDRDTSGVMLLARNPETHRYFNELFRERQIEKKYHGLVTPVPDWRTKDITLSLQTNADRKHRTRVNTSAGKEARSICKVEKIFDLGVLMEIQIMTGITHQIRAHLRQFDLALFGDSLYNAGLPEQPLSVSRTMLHARGISFLHPSTGEPMDFTAPYPDDFREAYTKLQTTRFVDAGF